MVDTIFTLFNNSAQAVTSWVTQVFSSTGMGYVYLGGFILFCFIRFVFVPMSGRKMGSDHARPYREKESSSSNSKDLMVI